MPPLLIVSTRPELRDALDIALTFVDRRGEHVPDAAAALTAAEESQAAGGLWGAVIDLLGEGGADSLDREALVALVEGLRHVDDELPVFLLAPGGRGALSIEDALDLGADGLVRLPAAAAHLIQGLAASHGEDIPRVPMSLELPGEAGAYDDVTMPDLGGEKEAGGAAAEPVRGPHTEEMDAATLQRLGALFDPSREASRLAEEAADEDGRTIDEDEAGPPSALSKRVQRLRQRRPGRSQSLGVDVVHDVTERIAADELDRALSQPTGEPETTEGDPVDDGPSEAEVASALDAALSNGDDADPSAIGGIPLVAESSGSLSAEDPAVSAAVADMDRGFQTPTDPLAEVDELNALLEGAVDEAELRVQRLALRAKRRAESLADEAPEEEAPEEEAPEEEAPEEEAPEEEAPEESDDELDELHSEKTPPETPALVTAPTASAEAEDDEGSGDGEPPVDEPPHEEASPAPPDLEALIAERVEQAAASARAEAQATLEQRLAEEHQAVELRLEEERRAHEAQLAEAREAHEARLAEAREAHEARLEEARLAAEEREALGRKAAEEHLQEERARLQREAAEEIERRKQAAAEDIARREEAAAEELARREQAAAEEREALEAALRADEEARIELLQAQTAAKLKEEVAARVKAALDEEAEALREQSAADLEEALARLRAEADADTERRVTEEVARRGEELESATEKERTRLIAEAEERAEALARVKVAAAEQRLRQEARKKLEEELGAQQARELKLREEAERTLRAELADQLRTEAEQRLAEEVAALRQSAARDTEEQLAIQEVEHRRLAALLEQRVREETEAQTRMAMEAQMLELEERARAEAEARAREEIDALLRQREEAEARVRARLAFASGRFDAAFESEGRAAPGEVGRDVWPEGHERTAPLFTIPFSQEGHDEPVEPPPPPAFRALEPAEGTFAEGEIGALLYSAHYLEVTGRVDLAHDDGRVRTLFLELGEPVAFFSTLASDRPEEFLLQAGLLTSAQRAELRAKDPLSARRLCAGLVHDGILKTHELFTAVRGVLTEQVLSVLEWDGGAFRYVEERAPAPDRVRMVQRFDAILADGLRRKYDEDRLWRVLGGPSTILGPAGRAPALPPLGPHERAAAQLFDGTRSLEDVTLEVMAPPEVILRAALILLACGSVHIVARGLPDTPETRMAQRARDVRIDSARVEDRLRMAREGDYFSFLGVGPTATTYEVQRAADRLAQVFDPSRFTDPAFAELWRSLQEIQDVVRDARAVLSDEQLREAYRRNSKRAGSAEQRKRAG